MSLEHMYPIVLAEVMLDTMLLLAFLYTVLCKLNNQPKTKLKQKAIWFVERTSATK